MILDNIEFEVRMSDSDEGIVEGYAVPWDETISVGGYKEKFQRGSIESVEDVKLKMGHEGLPIGKVLRGQDTDNGFLIQAKLSDTPRANEVRTLLKDGVLNKFSVGFAPVEDERDGDTVVRTKVSLKEISVVEQPAYANAEILAVRDDSEISNKGEDNMSEENNELVELRDGLDALERKVENIHVPAAAPAEEKPKYRSYGEYILGFANQEQDAIDLFKRYTVESGEDGGVVADAISKDAWIGSVVDIWSKPRRVLNAFDTATLPSSGMNVEYATLDTNSVQYEEQALEGDLLAYGKVSLSTETAPVKTYGGFTTMSFQEAQRWNNVNIIQTHFDAMNAAYAAKTNNEVRDVVENAANTQVLDNAGAGLDDTAVIIGIVVDAAQMLEDAHSEIDSIICSPGVFKSLATIVDGNNRPVLEFRPQGVNTIGTASANNLTATLLGVPVIVDPGATEPTFWIVNSDALLTLESPGVPLRLSDQDITHLTQTMSVYGYMAVALQRPDHIVKVENL